MEKHSKEGASRSKGPLPVTSAAIATAFRKINTAASLSGFAAMCAAYGTICQGCTPDAAFAEAAAAIAMAAATAAYAAAAIPFQRGMHERAQARQMSLPITADWAALGAEAAYTAARSQRAQSPSRSASILSWIVRLLTWPLTWPFVRRQPEATESPLERAIPYSSMACAMDCVTDAAVDAAAVAHSAVAAAAVAAADTTASTDDAGSSDCQTLQRQLNAAQTLDTCGRLAQASASAARTAAGVVRGTHPALSARADHAADAAMAASCQATTARLTLLAALADIPPPYPGTKNSDGRDMREWLSTLEALRAKTPRMEFDRCARQLATCSVLHNVIFAAMGTCRSIQHNIQNGLYAATPAAACAPDTSDTASSVTLAASSAGDDDGAPDCGGIDAGALMQ